MLRIVICEDDYNQRENLVDYIHLLINKEKLDASIVFYSGCYNEMIEFINTNDADLYLMDIDLGNEDYRRTGFELSKKIREKSKDTFIVFITDHDEYVFKSFDVRPYNFLRKPMSYERLDNTILSIYEEYMEKIDNDVCKISVASDGVIYMVRPKNIVYIEKISNNMINIKLDDGRELKSYMTLREIKESCCKKALTQTHISFLCNVSMIDSINYCKGEIIMNNGDKCLVSRTYKDELKRICEVLKGLTGLIVILL